MAPPASTDRPASKRDRTLPYTYEAWVDILAGRGREPLYDHYFSDTLCGLVECLAEEGVAPGCVKLFGHYHGQASALDVSVLLGGDGRWLQRPLLCHALEEHYAITHDECYRGHVEKSPCRFEDRDRSADGPVW